MNVSIRKSVPDFANEHVMILTAADDKWTGYSLSPEALTYVKNQVKEDKKYIEINRFSAWTFLSVLDNKEKNLPKQLETLRRAGERFAARINGLKFKKAVLVADKLSPELISAFVEGVLLGSYQFLKYRKEKAKEKNTFEKLEITGKAIAREQLEELINLTEAVYTARDLVNEPVMSLTASLLAEEFKALGARAGFKVEVFNKARIKALKMGGLLAVNEGSIDPPTFTVMEYKPKKPLNKKPIVLVGKGVVYDTGGLSLKPTPNSMDSMKCDMAGAAAVGCAMYAIAKNQLPLHVIALTPATDNRPGGNAYTPGDVITMHSGLTVEVLNTDAEGRLILADALSYAKQYDPELVMDFATLTGAAAAAIGQYGIVCMGGADDKTKKLLMESGSYVHERLVEFPMWEEYDDLIKSDIAEIKNVGGPYGGAITAGKFLARFVDYPWMHFDIAGPAFIKGHDSYRGKNGTGTGVRLIYDFLKRRAGL